MLPKDLLEHLEKGDRTMEHLLNSVTVSTSPQSAGELNDVLAQTSRWIGAQSANQMNQWIASSQLVGNSNIGGIVRW